MRKNRSIFSSSAIALAIAASVVVSANVIAQEKKQEEPSNILLPAVGGGFGSPGAVFFNSYGIVKDTPFAGVMVYDHVQTLNDGSRIMTRSSTPMYRDSQGRTRNEYSFKLPRPLGGESIEHITINIFDPVGGTSYMVDPQTRTVRKSTIASPAGLSLKRVGNTIGETPIAIRQLDHDVAHNVVPKINFDNARFKTVVEVLGKQLGLRVVFDESVRNTQTVSIDLVDMTIAKALDTILKTYRYSFEQVDDRTIRIHQENPAKSQSSESFESFYANISPSLKASSLESLPPRSESLGKQMIEGIEAEGTRITQTIAAGTMGNERPIEIIHERWYSRELQMDIMTKWNDPRSGESTQRLTNIIRSEPDASLFQPPPDYAIREATNTFMTKEGIHNQAGEKKRDPNDQ
jgi:Secretin and TonB N terminus short domain